MWILLVFPFFCKYGNIPVGYPKVYVGADCPLTVSTVSMGKGLSNVRFYLPGNCIIQLFGKKALQIYVSIVFRLCQHYKPRLLYKL